MVKTDFLISFLLWAIVVSMFIVYVDYRMNPQYYNLLKASPGFDVTLVERDPGIFAYYEVVPTDELREGGIFYANVGRTWKPYVETYMQKMLLAIIQNLGVLLLILMFVILAVKNKDKLLNRNI